MGQQLVAAIDEKMIAHQFQAVWRLLKQSKNWRLSLPISIVLTHSSIGQLLSVAL
jgi:hypothetical protein